VLHPGPPSRAEGVGLAGLRHTRQVNDQHDTTPPQALREGKYARIERERRFLLAAPVPAAAVTARRLITDRYLPGTRLRLRRVEYADGGATEFKFTQKVPSGQTGHVRGLITNTYLTPAEYNLLAELRADVIVKTRLTIPPLVIDIFEPPLHGLVLGETEFVSDDAARSFQRPPMAAAEVTDDSRFTGGVLVNASRSDLRSWLADYGLTLTP